MIERYDCWPKKITLGYSCTIYQYFCNRLSCIVGENRGSLGMIKKKLRFILAQNTSVQSRDMYFLLKKTGGLMHSLKKLAMIRQFVYPIAQKQIYQIYIYHRTPLYLPFDDSPYSYTLQNAIIFRYTFQRGFDQMELRLILRTYRAHIIAMIR
ncbi:hypothetical protein V1477_005827 [Vespula maculifrons]|uniref:Uncharacterized protein n=1 Tax=Vespula maculifrons TaxID=7453 RepID=A0ABD2CM60_VESMC